MHRLSFSAIALLALATPAMAQDPATAMATFIDAQGAEVGSVTLAQGEAATIAVTAN